MKTAFVLVVVGWGGSVSLLGQSVSVRGKSADEEWQAVQAQSAAFQSASGGSRRPAATQSVLSPKVTAARQLAASARQFHTSFPEHLMVAEARKLEAVASLQGVVDNDSSWETTAKATAQAYRADTRNRLADRVELAVLAERTAARAKFGGAVYVNNGPELEALADRLRKEFGEVQEMFDFYLSIARAADMNTSRSIAVKLLQSTANGTTKKEAQGFLDRCTLLGRTPELILRQTDGTPVELAQAGAKPTLVFYWSAAGPQLSQRALLSIPKNARVLHVMPSATSAQIDSAKRATRFPGAFCRDVSSGGNIGGNLRLGHLPFVLALDGSGKLAGFGPITVAETVFGTLGH